MYFAGLRVSEVCNLSPRDLNSKTMTLRVRQGKGGKDRSNLGVPTETWAVFERWAAIRPESRFFFCTLGGKRLSERYLHAMVGRYAAKAGVLKPTSTGDVPINPHVLRHSFAPADRGGCPDPRCPAGSRAFLLGHHPALPPRQRREARRQAA